MMLDCCPVIFARRFRRVLRWPSLIFCALAFLTPSVGRLAEAYDKTNGRPNEPSNLQHDGRKSFERP